MSSSDCAPHISLAEQAGTLDFNSVNSLSTSDTTRLIPGEPSNGKQKAPGTPGEEQALDRHEVIELQAFSERKAWIEEKIKVRVHILFTDTPYHDAVSFWRNYLLYRSLSGLMLSARQLWKYPGYQPESNCKGG